MSQVDSLRLLRVRTYCHGEIEQLRASDELAARDGKTDGGASSLVRLALERVLKIANGDTP